MQYVEFTQRQDIETLLNCMIHGFRFRGGVTATVLTDLGCGPHRWPAPLPPQDAGLCQLLRLCAASLSSVSPRDQGQDRLDDSFHQGSFWPGIHFDSLEDLNRQALSWCEEANRRIHGTAREVPLQRWAREGLTSLEGHPDYDTRYMNIARYRGIARFSGGSPA
jgi:transposase